MPDEYVTKFSDTYSRGGAILTVTVPSNDLDATEAEAVLSKYGHANVEVWQGEAMRTNISGSETPTVNR